MKPTSSPQRLAFINNDPTGAIRASFDVKLCYNVNQTASALGVSPTTVYRLTARGLLKPLRHIRHLAFPVAQLLSLTGGDGTVINMPSQIKKDRKNKRPKPAPTLPGPLEYDPSWPFLPGLSPDEVLARQEKRKGGCQ
ncbi:MAG: helix-turn-helix domain-containing protein [Prosthecobacter sp.]|nr:helix-turn-helix domain-containing protein [Prosthecobacter sp.]